MATMTKRVTKAERKQMRRDHLLNAVCVAIGRATGTVPYVHQITDEVLSLARAAESLRKRYEAACSYQWADTDEYRAKTERAENRIIERVKALGLHAYLQTDPRGATLYVDSKPIPDDNYTQAICICLD